MLCRPVIRWVLIFFACAVLLPFASPDVSLAQDDTAQQYQRAPEAIRRILEVPPTPLVSLSPTRDRLLLVQGEQYPPVAELAEPMLRLAGLRINPDTNGPHGAGHVVGLTIQDLADNSQRVVSVVSNPKLSTPRWSPDGRYFAFTNTTDKGIELWVAEADNGRAQRIDGAQVNAAYGDEFDWMPDSRTLICQTIPAGRGDPPRRTKAPQGPTIQESSGNAGPVRTYQDLLKDAHEEALFDYYATSQLVEVSIPGGHTTAIGKPAIIASIQPSPDGEHLLVVTRRRPYSYLHPAFAFPTNVEVWDRKGRVEYTLAELPLADRVPIEGVPTGPRSYHWRPTEPATLIWVEALDEGDPRKKVPHRDRVLMQKFPFREAPGQIARCQHRYDGLSWAEQRGLALLREYDRDRRWIRTHLLNIDQPQTAPRLVWDRSIQDQYGDPGSPIMRTLASGQRVLWQHGDSIFLDGSGATPQGDRPFLDRLDLTTLQSERLFQCDESSYEAAVALLSEGGSQFITRYETANEPPNYYLRTVDQSGKSALTSFPDPAPQLRGIHKQLVTYPRADGVMLSFTLYLPPGYQPGTPLPTLVWAYPREYSDPSTAGQVSGSPHRFTRFGGISHLFLLLEGYAILDGATMPVVGDPETMNDTYVQQIVSNAQAAIDKAVEMGVTDRERVAVGGHSYGAFMTANLLAHCDLFRAGIARSGAYNRTLTPFGFQSERRSLWEALDTYVKVSPFMVAHRIQEPLLLIHGEADNNSGTFPMQSERMYQAVRGNGGTVRLVMLPFESHGYAARESVEHTLYEMVSWLDRHVKQATPRSSAATAPATTP
jgi:dipeptidyl aminopeptidase/acylaminoacyl peptidase